MFSVMYYFIWDDIIQKLPVKICNHRSHVMSFTGKDFSSKFYYDLAATHRFFATLVSHIIYAPYAFT
jgi:hypothetical protein